MTDAWLFRAEVSLLIGAAVVLILWWLMAALDDRAHTAAIRLPIGVGLLVRLAAVAVAAAVPAIGHKLTTTDEATFLATTKTLAALPLTSGKWLSMGVHFTELIPWALTYKLFGVCGTLPLRLEQIGFNLAAVILVSAVAGRIGGRRAARLTAWIAVLEPSGAYFGGLLHQESLCMLGEALLLTALADIWMAEKRRWRPATVGLLGLALIFGTRSYLAFFGIVAVVLVFSAWLLQRRLGLRRGLGLLSVAAPAVGVAGIFAAPRIVPGSLSSLQRQLDAPYPGANLPLPHATVTNGPDLLRTVVLHSVDLMLRPFPWQTASAAQKAAVAGTLIWYALVLITAWLAASQRFDARLLPALVLIICATIGFALTLVDAGEGFRHRVNLELILAVPLGVMLDRWLTARRGRTRGMMVR